MKFSILTLFPEMFSPFNYSILNRAQDAKLIDIELVNIRDFSQDRHHSVDDHPYGGGVGMVMRVDVIDKAIESAKSTFRQKTCSKQANQKSNIKQRIILLDPRGKKFDQKTAKRLSKYQHLILVCGHYEGVDERVKKLVDESVSIGDYILTGGEIPAMVLVDSITRLLSGVLKKQEATLNESFNTAGYLEYPQYTKPQTYKNMPVPKVLLNGDHKKIGEWRTKKSEELTNHQQCHSCVYSVRKC